MFWYSWRDPNKRLQWKGCKQLYLILQLVTKLQLSIFIWDVLFAKGVLFVFAKGAKCGIIFEQLFTKAGKYVYCLYSLWGFEGMSPWWKKLDLKHQRYLQQPSLTFLNGYLARVLGNIYNSWPCIHIYLEGITKLPKLANSNKGCPKTPILQFLTDLSPIIVYPCHKLTH